MKRSNTGWAVRDIVAELFENDINPAAWMGTQINDEACSRAAAHMADYRAAVLEPVKDLWVFLPVPPPTAGDKTKPLPRIFPVLAMSSDRRFVRVLETLSRTVDGRKQERDITAILDTKNVVARVGPKTNFIDVPVNPIVGGEKEMLKALGSQNVVKSCYAWLRR